MLVQHQHQQTIQALQRQLSHQHSQTLARDQTISGLRSEITGLTANLKQTEQALQHSRKLHESCKVQLADSSSLVEQLKEQLAKAQDQYRMLYSTHIDICRENSAKLDYNILDGHNRLQKHLLDIEVKAQKQRVRELQEVASRNQELCRSLAQDNARLNTDLLKLTSDYNSKIMAFHKQLNSHHETVSAEKGQDKFGTNSQDLKDLDHKVLTSTTEYFESVLKIKQHQLQQHHATIKSQQQSVAHLTTQLSKALEILQLKESASKNSSFSTLEQLLMQNEILKQENTRLAETHQKLLQEVPELDAYRNKMKSYVKEANTLKEVQSQVQKLHDQMTKLSSQHAEKVKLLQDEIQRLKKEKALAQENLKQEQEKDSRASDRLYKYEIILDKFNRAFVKMNPYFNVYRYDLDGFTEEEVKIIESSDFQNKLTILKKSESKERQLEQRERALKQESKKVKAASSPINTQQAVKPDTAAKKNDVSASATAELKLEVDVKATLDHHQKVFGNLLSIIATLRQKCLRLSRTKPLAVRHPAAPERLLLHTQSSLRLVKTLSEIKLPDLPAVKEGHTDLADSLQMFQDQIDNFASGIKAQADSTSRYLEHIVFLKASVDQMGKRSSKLAEENQELRTNLATQTKQKAAPAMEEEKRVQDGEQGELVGPQATAILQQNAVPNFERIVSSGHLASLEETNGITKEAMDKVSQILASNQTLIGDLWTKYQLLAQKYKLALKRLKQSIEQKDQELSQEDEQVEGEEVSEQSKPLKKHASSEFFQLQAKLSQALIRIKQSDLATTHLEHLVAQLTQENEGLNRELKTLQDQRSAEVSQSESQIRKLKQELQGMEQRYLQPVHNNQPGQHHSVDQNVVRALKMMLLRKNTLIQELEEKERQLLHELGQDSKGERQARKRPSFIETEQIRRILDSQKAAEIIDKAAYAIRTIRQ